MLREESDAEPLWLPAEKLQKVCMQVTKLISRMKLKEGNCECLMLVGCDLLDNSQSV